MNFDELSDDEWVLVAPLVAEEPPIRINRRGRPRAEPRVVANAVLWILTTGESWSRLPARYPSGPTCRRRFDEWHSSGTLGEIVQRLTQAGRKFIYVPEPPRPAAQNVVAAIEEPAEDDGLPAVYWKSPESWQAPTHVAGARLADPIERMTQHLARIEPPIAPVTPVTPAAPTISATMNVPTSHSPRRDDRYALARSAPRTSDATALAAAQATEWRGYVMKVTVQPVRNRMYRAAVEILKDDVRVERSGLIGPPFQDRDAARHFALDWAHEWIERECRAASATRATNTVVTRAPAVSSNTAAAAVATSPGVADKTGLLPWRRYCVQLPASPHTDEADEADDVHATSSATPERRTVDQPARRETRTHAG